MCRTCSRNTHMYGPGMFDLKGRAKWNAWKQLGSMSKGDAMTAYIKLIGELAPLEAKEQSATAAEVCMESFPAGVLPCVYVCVYASICNAHTRKCVRAYIREFIHGNMQTCEHA